MLKVLKLDSMNDAKNKGASATATNLSMNQTLEGHTGDKTFSFANTRF